MASGAGVRSVGEVYVHVAETHVLLPGYLGVRADFPGPRFSGKESGSEISARFPEFERPVEMFGRKTTARGVYLRILAHANEHMGQSIAYARINGVVPPWSK